MSTNTNWIKTKMEWSRTGHIFLSSYLFSPRIKLLEKSKFNNEVDHT